MQLTRFSDLGLRVLMDLSALAPDAHMVLLSSLAAREPQALAQAGLDARSGPLKGVTETIRKALASAGLGGGAVASPADADVIDADLSRRDFTVNAMALSLPDPGSVRPKQAISPAAMRGHHSAFCASVPPFLIAELNIPTLIEKIERNAGAA